MEVALLAPHTAGSIRQYRHRILGTINFDTPFLGMHPGVIASGLSSLFRSAPESPGPEILAGGTADPVSDSISANDGLNSSASSSYFGPTASNSAMLLPTESSSSTTLPVTSPLSPYNHMNDPNYNPPFPNDIRMKQRTCWKSVGHFINKHSDGLARATQSYVTSHLEFGGCLADYNGLKTRYAKIRTLEDGRENVRVRFVNYYTASTGRPKRVKEVGTRDIGQDDEGEETMGEGVSQLNLDSANRRPASTSPRVSIERAEDEAGLAADGQRNGPRYSSTECTMVDDEGALTDGSLGLEHIVPVISAEEDEEEATRQDTTSAMNGARKSSSQYPLASLSSVSIQSLNSTQSLPPLLPTPEEPAPFVKAHEDKEMRKLAKNEHDRQVKAYRRAVKDRDKAIKDRRKYLEKRAKVTAKEKAKTTDAALAAGDGAELMPCPSNSDTRDPQEKSKNPPRDRKFCMLPSRVNCEIDPCWVRVFMPGMDEVGAHCGLFFVDGERYAWFVGNVSGRIGDWVGGRREG